jgi:ankyrin repeat protein
METYYSKITVDRKLYKIIKLNPELVYLLDDDHDKKYDITHRIKSKKLNLLQKLILISNKYPIITNYLIKHANLYINQMNYQNKKGWSSLMIACSNTNKNSTKLIKMLLKNKSDPNIQDIKGWSSLMTTVIYSENKFKYEIMKMLIDHNADVNLENNLKKTALSYYCQYNHTKQNKKIIKLLLDNHSDPNIQDIAGLSPLMYSCARSNLKIIKILLEYNTDPNFQNINGWTALIKLIEYPLEDDIIKKIKLLLDYDINVNLFSYDKKFNMLMYLCCYKSNQDQCIKLLKQTTDLDHLDIGNKKIHEFCRSEYKILFKKV